MPSPTRDREEQAKIAGKTGVVSIANFLRRRVRVQINWNSKRRSGFENRKEARIVEKKSVRGAVEKNSIETELRDAAV